MFTGIVEEVGRVLEAEALEGGRRFRVGCSFAAELRPDESVATNGVCLTVTALDGGGFVTGLAPETRQRTNLDALDGGARVNLERSVTPSTRMGGHFVQGHVDGTGTIESFRPDADALWVTVRAPRELMRYVVPKGYVALDGTSLTVVDAGEDTFSVTLVAYTRSHVVLPTRVVGDAVNIEVDVLGKYVERLLSHRTEVTE